MDHMYLEGMITLDGVKCKVRVNINVLVSHVHYFHVKKSRQEVGELYYI